MRPEVEIADNVRVKVIKTMIADVRNKARTGSRELIFAH